jgi:hypothetical protein
MRFGGLFRERSFYQSRAARSAYRGLRRGASKAGLQVVLKTFYSPIPDLDELPAGAFDRRSELPAIGWDLDVQLEEVRTRLASAMAEFRPPSAAPGDRWQYVPNDSYTVPDAAVLHAMVRTLKPRRIVELGSGHSTLVTAGAARRNAAEGHPVSLEVFDPFPSVVAPELPGLTRLERTGAQDVPFEVFERLQSGDILFVDTTHTVKIGSDVNHILLEILPRLAPGVVVHLHDIFLPYEYPRVWLEDYGLYWGEQYLLQAFLAFNSGYEITAAVYALKRDRPAEMAALLPPGNWDGLGAAFWMRRTAP